MKPLSHILCLAGALALAGCALPGGDKRATTHYALAVQPAPAAAGDPGRGVLLLDETRAVDFLSSSRIAYSRAPGTLARYQYARWQAPPARALHGPMRRHVEAAGVFAAVASFDAGVRGDYLLNSRLLAFHHDIAVPPGSARVELEAELIDRADARLIARETFVAEAPAPSFDAAGAAAALGEASGQALRELGAWLARVRPRDAR
jgi:cholesterol transport system auxiliary component